MFLSIFKKLFNLNKIFVILFILFCFCDARAALNFPIYGGTTNGSNDLSYLKATAVTNNGTTSLTLTNSSKIIQSSYTPTVLSGVGTIGWRDSNTLTNSSYGFTNLNVFDNIQWGAGNQVEIIGILSSNAVVCFESSADDALTSTNVWNIYKNAACLSDINGNKTGTPNWVSGAITSDGGLGVSTYTGNVGFGYGLRINGGTNNSWRINTAVLGGVPGLNFSCGGYGVNGGPNPFFMAFGAHYESLRIEPNGLISPWFGFTNYHASSIPFYVPITVLGSAVLTNGSAMSLLYNDQNFITNKDTRILSFTNSLDSFYASDDQTFHAAANFFSSKSNINSSSINISSIGNSAAIAHWVIDGNKTDTNSYRAAMDIGIWPSWFGGSFSSNIVFSSYCQDINFYELGFPFVFQHEGRINGSSSYVGHQSLVIDPASESFVVYGYSADSIRGDPMLYIDLNPTSSVPGIQSLQGYSKRPYAGIGTISSTGGFFANITGTGTYFTTNLTVGSSILIGNTVGFVTKITDDTHLTVYSVDYFPSCSNTNFTCYTVSEMQHGIGNKFTGSGFNAGGQIFSFSPYARNQSLYSAGNYVWNWFIDNNTGNYLLINGNNNGVPFIIYENNDINFANVTNLHATGTATLNGATVLTNGSAMSLLNNDQGFITNNATYPILSSSPSTNSPAANEFITANYFNNAISRSYTYYSTTNLDGTNPLGVVVYYYSASLPATFTNTFSSLVNGQYINGLTVSNIYAYSAPFSRSIVASATATGGNPSCAIHFENFWSTNNGATWTSAGTSSSFSLTVDGSFHPYTEYIKIPGTIAPGGAMRVYTLVVVDSISQVSLLSFMGGTNSIGIAGISFNSGVGNLGTLYQPINSTLTSISSGVYPAYNGTNFGVNTNGNGIVGNVGFTNGAVRAGTMGASGYGDYNGGNFNQAFTCGYGIMRFNNPLFFGFLDDAKIGRHSAGTLEVNGGSLGGSFIGSRTNAFTTSDLSTGQFGMWNSNTTGIIYISVNVGGSITNKLIAP